MSAMTILDWRPVDRNTLRGFATIRIDGWHLCIADIAVHEANGKWWAQLPSKPMITADRQLVVKDGKVQYAKLVWWADDETRHRFSDAVIAALDAYQDRDAPRSATLFGADLP